MFKSDSIEFVGTLARHFLVARLPVVQRGERYLGAFVAAVLPFGSGGSSTAVCKLTWFSKAIVCVCVCVCVCLFVFVWGWLALVCFVIKLARDGIPLLQRCFQSLFCLLYSNSVVDVFRLDLAGACC